MKPRGIGSRIFLDGGDPGETREVLGLLGFLDGQTTNPTLIARNPAAQSRLVRDGRFEPYELLDFYRQVVQEISRVIPEGSVSVEVYADAATQASAMLVQGREMFSWIPNAHVKFPTCSEGLAAAAEAVRTGLRVNMTLCFSQEQAAAVHAATRGARRGDVYVSPFIGRLDDRGEDGMELIESILRMFRGGDGHVLVLTASVRRLDHLLRALQLRSDIVTAPAEVLREWAARGMPVPGNDCSCPDRGLRPIPYREIDLSKAWPAYDLSHDLTDRGMEKFSEDWNALVKADGASRALAAVPAAHPASRPRGGR